MDSLISLFFSVINAGVALGLMQGALLLARPLLRLLLSAQQRAVVWTAGWSCCALAASCGRVKAILPVSFWDLVVPRTGPMLDSGPAFLPAAYHGPGPYHLALTGGILVRVELHTWFLAAAMAIWLGGVAALLLLFLRQRIWMGRAAEAGREMSGGSPLLQNNPLFRGKETRVWVCSGLPTSFVRQRLMAVDGHRHEIYLQQELSPQRLELVLLHELQHIRLLHCWWKCLATVSLVLNWWNPLVWLGFRCFCQDLELACDSAVMKRLEPKRRREYARLLVELGAGRQLWEAPLSFGECDGAVRARALACWRPARRWRQASAWAAALLLAAFFIGGHMRLAPARDMLLTWEREGGGIPGFARRLGQEMEFELGGRARNVSDLPGLEVTGVWEAPEHYPRSALWVQVEEEQWYHVYYAWWSDEANWIGVLSVEAAEPPDLENADKLL